MATTPRMQWPIPAEGQDPWYDVFVSMVNGMDASSYAARDDRNIILTGGGSVTFNALTNALAWSQAFEIAMPVQGMVEVVPAGGVTLLDGQVLYVDLVRSPVAEVTLVPQVATVLPVTDSAYALAVRKGGNVYWRNGRGGGDELVRVTSDDLVAGYLGDKLSAGTGITLTVTSPGGEEVLEIAAASPGPAVFDAVADVAALSALDITDRPSGATVFVRTLKDTFVLDKASALATDAVNFMVVATSAAGRWLRKGDSHPEWLLQLDWYVNPSTGDNENSGEDAGNALATFAELNRRLHGQMFLGNDVNIYIQSDVTVATDPLIIDFGVQNPGVGAGIWVTGARTTVGSGTVTGVVPLDPTVPSGGQACEVTDTSRVWAGSEGDLFVTTTTPGGNPVEAWVAKDLGTNRCRVSTPRDASTGASTSAFNGQAYQLQRGVRIPDLVITQPGTVLYMDSVEFTAAVAAFPPGCFLRCASCRFKEGLLATSIPSTSRVELINCCVDVADSTVVLDDTTATFDAGMFFGRGASPLIRFKGAVLFWNYAMFQHVGVQFLNVKSRADLLFPQTLTEAQENSISVYDVDVDTLSREYYAVLAFFGKTSVGALSVFGVNNSSVKAILVGDSFTEAAFKALNLYADGNIWFRDTMLVEQGPPV